jgi:threonylcarbamoyladenosine tRNA methylthiotransferase MtaB
MPDCAIGVDVITGFPGETDEDFLETYQFLNELDVSYLHVFTYSERANTEALKMENTVPQAVRNKRSKMLRGLSEKKKRHFYEQHIHGQYSVLFEDDVEDGMMHGFTENYIRVSAKYDPILINETKQVVLAQVGEKGHMEVNELEELVVH